MTFPRTSVGGIEISRMICGTNPFYGYSHYSPARDTWLRRYFTMERIVEVMEACANAGINAVMSSPDERTERAIEEVKRSTGAEFVWICTPGSRDFEETKESIRWAADHGAKICMPHMCFTDSHLVPGENRLIHAEEITELIRSLGMVPGLSTHRPETITTCDEAGYDFASYIQPYNVAGFLCHYETDWLQRVFNRSPKPIMCVKPLAAGSVLPGAGLRFVWSTIKPIDLVVLGMISPEEVQEDVEFSLNAIAGIAKEQELAFTRSKKMLTSSS
ncbi:MAG: hypothetical protein ABIH23_06685 [bacterium]